MVNRLSGGFLDKFIDVYMIVKDVCIYKFFFC